MLQSIVAICVGASSGAVLRWWLGVALNALFPAIPLGTLAANWIGGYGAGLAMGLFVTAPSLDPAWRLLIMTGFLGGLTTFSSFSVDVISLLQQGRWGLASSAIALHVIGSLLMPLAGCATVTLLRSAH